MGLFNRYFSYTLKEVEGAFVVEVFAPSSEEKIVKVLRFLLDTGCDISCIKNGSIVNGKIDCERKNFPMQTVGIGKEYIDSAEIGFIHIVNERSQMIPYVPFIIIDDSNTNIEYDGLLGISFLKDSIIDLNKRILKCPADGFDLGLYGW